MTSIGHKLYVFGGCGLEGRLNDLWEFDTESSVREWRALPVNDTIKPRGGPCLVPSPGGERLYVIGGFCGEELADVHCFNVAAGKWNDANNSCAVLPVARSMFGAAFHPCGSSSCEHHGRLFAFGGEVDPSDKGRRNSCRQCLYNHLPEPTMSFSPACHFIKRGGHTYWVSHHLQIKERLDAPRPLAQRKEFQRSPAVSPKSATDIVFCMLLPL